MFDCIIAPRLPVSHAKLYAGYARFCGEVWPGRWDARNVVVQAEPELPNDLEALKTFTRRVMAELTNETNQNQRCMRFTARLAKKLVCLGQLSNNELQTSYNLGLHIEVSNIHWLLDGSPWNTTREATTSTDSYLFEIDDGQPTYQSTWYQPTKTEKKLGGRNVLGIGALKKRQTVSANSSFSESPNMLEPSSSNLELHQLSGLSETNSSVLSEPIPYVNPRAFRVPHGETERYSYPYRAPSTESGFNMRMPDSLVVLHKDVDFMFKKSSVTCCTPVLNPLSGGFRTHSDAAQFDSLVEKQKENTNERGAGPSRPPILNPNHIGFDTDDPNFSATYVLEPDEDGTETILVMPDDDPLTHYEERITTVEHIHDQQQTELEVALRKAEDISKMATFIVNAVSQERVQRTADRANASSNPQPLPTNPTRKRLPNQSLKIPMQNFNRKPPRVETGAPIGVSPSGEPESASTIAYQLAPEISSYRQRRLKMKSAKASPAKRWNGAFK